MIVILNTCREIAKKLKRRSHRLSRSEKAVDDENLDLEATPVQALRQHKPRVIKKRTPKVRKATPVAEEIRPPTPVTPATVRPVTPAVIPPISPFSIPPPSPCKTPSFPILQPTNQVVPSAEANNDIFFYDLNLNCPQRRERRRTESGNGTAIELMPPSSFQLIQEDQLVVGTPKAPPIAVKQEQKDPSEADEDDKEEEEEEEEESWVDGLDLSNLVVIEKDNAFKVHFIDQETDEVSEEPLELPQEVIDYIVAMHQKQLGQIPKKIENEQ